MVRILMLFATLAMLATPARAAGRNVVLFGADDHGTEAFGAYGNGVVKTPRLMQRPAFELYDLERDPLEVVNLAADPKYAQLLSELKARIKAFQERTGDPWVTKWRHE